MAKASKKLPKGLADNKHSHKISAKIADIFGHVGSNEKAYVVLKYYQSKNQCFSTWDRPLLKNFSKFINTISSKTWSEIYLSAGKGRKNKKTGLGYTPHNNSVNRIRKKCPNLASQLDDDILESFFELRLGEQPRVHGFRQGQAFFLVILDKDHTFLD